MFHNPTPLNVSQKSGPRYSCISYITTRTSLRRRSYTGVRDAAHFSHFPDRDRTGARNARGHTMGHTPWPGSARHARARNTRAPVSGRRGVRRPGPRRDGREKYEGKESINGAYYRRDQFFSLAWLYRLRTN